MNALVLMLHIGISDNTGWGWGVREISLEKTADFVTLAEVRSLSGLHCVAGGPDSKLKEVPCSRF